MNKDFTFGLMTGFFATSSMWFVFIGWFFLQ